MSEPGKARPSQSSVWRRLGRLVIKAFAGLVLVIVLAVVFLFVYPSTRPPARTVRPLGTISINRPFRFTRPFIDYLTLEGPTLYVAFASHDLVGLIDTRTARGTGAVSGLPRVHGIAIAPEMNLAFTSNGEDNTVGVLDLAHQRLVKKIPGGVDPDAIAYDAKPRLIYVADHDGKTATVIDPASGAVVATIALGGEPEFCQADPDSGLVYQNLQDTSEVAVVDPAKQAVIRRYKLDPGQGPTGLAFDASHHRLFAATSNRKLVVLNSDTGQLLAVLPIGLGVDGAAYDPELQRIYTANGLGSMTVIRQDSPDRYQVLEDVPTHFGGHSLVVDPVTHRIYIAYFGSIAVYEPIPSE
jgi:YVTN family beta-propeller protein